MLFYEEVKKERKGGLAPPLIRGGEPIPRSPISPLPEGGDKLTQLQVTLCIVVGQSFDQTLVRSSSFFALKCALARAS